MTAWIRCSSALILLVGFAHALITRVITRLSFFSVAQISLFCQSYATNLHDDLYRDHACLAQRSFPLIFWLACFASLHVSTVS